MVQSTDPREGSGSPTGSPNDPRPPSKPFILDKIVFTLPFGNDGRGTGVNGWAILGLVIMAAFIVFV